MIKMTIKEFYEWGKKNGVENAAVEIQYRDDGGYYNGTDDLNGDLLDIQFKSYGTIVVI